MHGDGPHYRLARIDDAAVSETIRSPTREETQTCPVAFDPAESAASVLRGWVHAMLSHRHGNEVYQTSTMGALLDGVYDGDVTIRELLQHGDFGLGTFNGLDGEMLVLDGVCYQLRGDGSAHVAESGPAHPVRRRHLVRRRPHVRGRRRPSTAPGSKRASTSRLPSRNLIVAVRVDR